MYISLINSPLSFERYNKIKQTTSKLTNASLKDYEIFENKVRKNKIKNKNEFYKCFLTIFNSFKEQNKLQLIEKKLQKLAEILVSEKKQDYAGIIYSTLVHNAEGKEKLTQQAYIQNAKKNSERQQDWIHTVARNMDLRKLYKDNPEKQEDYKKVLYELKNNLQKICNNYEDAKQKFATISRPIQPLEVYKKKLTKIMEELSNL